MLPFGSVPGSPCFARPVGSGPLPGRCSGRFSGLTMLEQMPPVRHAQ